MAYVVPVKHDRIKTKDGELKEVYSYTNLKEDPAVYSIDGDHISFLDIEEINKVKVEFDKSSKTFKAYGTIKRQFHIPQPGDTFAIEQKGEKITSVVDEIKLHNSTFGITKGLGVCDSTGCYPLTEIVNLETQDGGIKFNRKKFLRYYKDYLPIGA